MPRQRVRRKNPGGGRLVGMKSTNPLHDNVSIQTDLEGVSLLCLHV